MQNADQRNESAEQFNAPTPASADLVRQDLDKGNLTAAERAYLDNQGIYTDAELQEIDKSADNQLRENSPEDLPEGPLNEEQAESAMKAADDDAITKYGAENKPGMAEIMEGQEVLERNEQILKELEQLIAEASKEGTKGKVGKLATIPFSPLIGGVYAILKGRKMKKKLAELQGNIDKLQNVDSKLKELASDKTLDPDKISPNGGHLTQIAGYSSAFVGGKILTAAGVTAKTTLSGMAAASPVGLGLLVGGAAVGLAGFIKVIMSYKNITKSQESLDKFRDAVSDAHVQNKIQQSHLQTYSQSYAQGARENIQQNFPGTLAA
jgi:hypothetical protein